jgi:hypothetical protein
LEREVAGIYVVMNTKEMRMVVADLKSEPVGTMALQPDPKHPWGTDSDVALIQLKLMANLGQGMEEGLDLELEVGQVAFGFEELSTGEVVGGRVMDSQQWEEMAEGQKSFDFE